MRREARQTKGATGHMELLWIVLIIGGWILLQAVILPRFGVPT
jgi:hypothetical protein